MFWRFIDSANVLRAHKMMKILRIRSEFFLFFFLTCLLVTLHKLNQKQKTERIKWQKQRQRVLGTKKKLRDYNTSNHIYIKQLNQIYSYRFLKCCIFRHHFKNFFILVCNLLKIGPTSKMILTIFPTVKSSIALLNLYYKVVIQTSLSRFPSVLPSYSEFTASPMTSNNALYLSRCSTVQNNVDCIEALSYSV
jgi:hypothetical protein